MIEGAWDAFLELASRFIIPDWGSLIALLPVALLAIVALWLALTVKRFATAGPTRRGKARIVPAPPSGIHLPGPSWAPVFAAAGAFLLFWGLVVGGVAIGLGIVALTVTLLYWGREGLLDYDRVARAEAALPAVVHAGPPPGVHMPGPSFRPILGALGVSVLFFGLVFGGWLLVVGIVLTIATMLGWLVDARREYVHTLQADSTGHLQPLPDPAWPRRLLWIGAALVVLAIVVDIDILPPRSAAPAGGTGAGASGEPPASGGPAPSASAGPGPSLPQADTVITAQGVQFVTKDVQVAGPDFTIAFDNRDQNTPHDVDIRDAGGAVIFDGDVFPGPAARVYEVTGLQPASYEFFCSVHVNMTGKITVQ